MKYSKTGNFTAKQIRLAEEIDKKIAELNRTGLSLFSKENELVAYKRSELFHATDKRGMKRKSKYEIKSLYCGYVSDSGADDAEYFEEGYITEE